MCARSRQPFEIKAASTYLQAKDKEIEEDASIKERRPFRESHAMGMEPMPS
jgi:hypothetical protein